MSSTSIARQNRRKRLNQNIKNSPKILSTLETLSVLELKSKSNAESSDSCSRDFSNTVSCDSTACKKPESSQNEPYETLSFVTDSVFLNYDISSQPVGKIYIEGERGFREINASQIFQISSAELSIQSHKNSPMYQALKYSKYLHNLSNFCHGLLGGISLLYLLVLLHLFSNLSIDSDTIKYFSFFSKPVHNVFNFLCIICCVSVFDRFDISNTGEFFKSIKKLDFKLIALLIYPISLLLSLSTANVDDELNFLEKNITSLQLLSYKNAQVSLQFIMVFMYLCAILILFVYQRNGSEIHRIMEESDLYLWKTLNISKCFGALLGWIVLCWDQNFNSFIDYLRSILHRRKILQ